MPSRKPDPWLLVAVAGGALYPVLAYFGQALISSTALIFCALVLVGVRLFALRRSPDIQFWRMAFLVVTTILLGLLCVNAKLAVLLYPVMISLSLAAVFGLSLLFPPSFVERIARLSEPDLPPSGIVYTRRVTIIWTAFLIVNAVISAATAIWGSFAEWALWNSFLSYFCMGVLFVGEWIVRHRVRR